MLFYIDTCIWIDYLEDRKDRFKPLGDWAHELLQKIIESENMIIFSNFTKIELNKRYSIEKIKEMIEPYKEKIIFLDISNECLRVAKDISRTKNIHFEDSVHIAVAKKNNAILITRDSHFQNATDIVQIFKPEDLI